MSPPTPEACLKDLGITLPEAPAPVASYVPAVRTGNLVFVSGQIPLANGTMLATGSVPEEVDFETAVACARQCGLNALAIVRREIGSLDRVRRVVRLGCFVQCPPGYPEQPKVANGASHLMQEVFGEAGRHTRAAVGATGLPLNAPVEVEFVFEIDGD